MDDVQFSVHEAQVAEQAQRQAERQAQDWLFKFEAALRSRDPVRLSSLFHADCHWRDVLAFTWHLSSATGREAVADGLAEGQRRADARDFHLPRDRRAPRRMTRLGIDCVEAIFEFETGVGRGAGVVRLSADDSDGRDGEMRAWLVSTVLDSLRGHEEMIGERRPSGAAYSRNFGGDNWADMRRRAIAYEDREPAVLVIGGAQSGLAIAARLNQLGVDTLVIERWNRIGDSWRRRYHSLALHNSAHINHLPYMDFPATWPTYIPKDMLGNWFEFYADAMEINCWTGTEFVGGTWDEADQRWTARLRREDGSERIVRPRHLVFANGVQFGPDRSGLARPCGIRGHGRPCGGVQHRRSLDRQERAGAGDRQQRQRHRAGSAQQWREHDHDPARVDHGGLDQSERPAERGGLRRGQRARRQRPDHQLKPAGAGHQGLQGGDQADGQAGRRDDRRAEGDRVQARFRR